MNLDRVGPGRDVPNDVNVIIEIPMNADPIKYEVDKETGAMFVDRFMSTAMRYPCNYGYVPHTLSGDGDPVDVLVLSPAPLISETSRSAEVPPMSTATTKVLAVPIDKLSSLYRQVETIRDLPELVTAQISHFFEHYKDLEPGKWVKLLGWVGPEEAKAEILAGIRSYDEAATKPMF